MALDAMHNMQASFCHRYTLASAVDRRSGGQGVVQFADIAGTRDRVRRAPRPNLEHHDSRATASMHMVLQPSS